MIDFINTSLSYVVLGLGYVGVLVVILYTSIILLGKVLKALSIYRDFINFVRYKDLFKIWYKNKDYIYSPNIKEGE